MEYLVCTCKCDQCKHGIPGIPSAIFRFSIEYDAFPARLQFEVCGVFLGIGWICKLELKVEHINHEGVACGEGGTKFVLFCQRRQEGQDGRLEKLLRLLNHPDHADETLYSRCFTAACCSKNGIHSRLEYSTVKRQ